MTLRSRRKPRITAPILTATAIEQPGVESSVDLIEPFSWCDIATAERQNNACAVALVFVLLSVAFVLPVRADDTNGNWGPSRPKQSLSSKRVAAKKSKSEWDVPKRLEDTSSHLPWGVLPKRTATPVKSKAKQELSKKSLADQRDMPRRVRGKHAKSQAKPTFSPTAVPSTPAPRAPQIAVAIAPGKQDHHHGLLSKERILTQRELALAKRELALTKQQLELAQKTQQSQVQLLSARTAKPDRPIRQAQHVDDLRSPYATNGASTSSAGIEVSIPNQKQVAFNAPSPRDLFSASEQPTKTAQRFQFKDMSSGTQTKPVQESRFEDSLFGDGPATADSEPLGFDLDDLAPATDSEQSSSPFGESNPSDVSPREDLFSPSPSQPRELPSNNLPPAPTSELPTPEPVRDSPLDNVAPSDSLGENPDQLRKRLREELKELQQLPNLGGAEDPEPDDSSDPDEDSDLFSDEEPPEESDNDGEFDATNGRDCVKEAASCRTDLNYLKRRERITEISLNITPSLTPAEVDMAAAEETRIEKMGEAPLRTWRDRSGNVIADGNLEDYRHDKVVIRTVNGSFRSVPTHKLSDVDRCFVAGWWGVPSECNFESERYQMRDFRLTTFTWTAAGTCHKPLYFEQVGVERYGHSSGPIIQPLVSGVHFFGDIVMMPYHVGIHPPKECVYTLGHYRPGECAPWLVPGFPVAKRGFSWQGLALGAAIALLP